MKKIVVIDDQPMLGTIYRAKFAAEGFQVDVAADGQQGLDLIQRTNPDLILLDLMMPGIAGLEVLKELRTRPTFRTLPIIVFSGSARPGITEEAWAAGATMVLSKTNTSPKQVIEFVRQALAETAAAPVSREAPEDATPMGGSGDALVRGNIVLLEIHADTRAMISFLLRQAGHNVTTTYTHDEMVRFAQANQVDLFLINRGRCDSCAALCRQLRVAFPNTPVTVYSTAASAKEKEEGLNAGAAKYLTTPEDLLRIGEISASIIRAHQAPA
jgi:CheY-like chemotaxis protein